MIMQRGVQVVDIPTVTIHYVTNTADGRCMTWDRQKSWIETRTDTQRNHPSCIQDADSMNGKSESKIKTKPETQQCIATMTERFVYANVSVGHKTPYLKQTLARRERRENRRMRPAVNHNMKCGIYLTLERGTKNERSTERQQCQWQLRHEHSTNKLQDHL